MTRQEMALLLAKVQLGDNRNVDQLVLEYWLDLIGDMPFAAAMEALRLHRRQRPGVYLEPGHLLELSGIQEESTAIPDITAQIVEASKQRMLAAAGVTEADYLEHAHDVPWLRSHFPTAFEQHELLTRYPNEEIPDE